MKIIFNIKVRFIILFLVVMLASAAVGLYTYFTFTGLNELGDVDYEINCLRIDMMQLSKCGKESVSIGKFSDKNQEELFENIQKTIKSLSQSSIGISLESSPAFASVNTKIDEYGKLLRKTRETQVQSGVPDPDASVKLEKIFSAIDQVIVGLQETLDREYDATLSSRGKYLIIIVLIIFTTVSITVLRLYKSIAEPIATLKGVIGDLGLGKLPKETVQVKRQDEIGEVAAKVDELISGLRKLAVFADRIGKGELDSDFTLLSDEDMLGNSLINMRQSLIDATREEEKRKAEDDKRNWTTQGLASFGDILRQNNNLDDFLYNIISNLVKYLNANQGGLFVVGNTINDIETTKASEKERFLELKACYAYERRKMINKKILFGEGCVGTCAIEMEKIYMTDIPQNYIQITSGLGQANPTSLLIIPLKLNEEIYGVLELASFHEIEPYQMEFIEKLAESIASTISNMVINEQTAKLLKESQAYAEQMSQQEEEMRQNMEEMMSTQEEMARKEEKLKVMTEELNDKNNELTQVHEALKQKDIEQQNEIERIRAINHEQVQSLEKINMEMQESIDEFQSFCKEESDLKQKMETELVKEIEALKIELEALRGK